MFNGNYELLSYLNTFNDLSKETACPLFFTIWTLPTPKYSLILYNKDKSLSFSSIAYAGTICQPVLHLLFLLIETENEDLIHFYSCYYLFFYKRDSFL